MFNFFPYTMLDMMKKKHMTNLDMCKAIGVSKATFYRYLSCKNEPTLREIIRICNVLDCTPNELIPEACKKWSHF